MKKLSLLVALALLVTVGGVYATWTYSGHSIDPQTEPFVSKMGALDHEGNSGAYSFSNNSLDFSVEPDDQMTKNTTIRWGTGTITLTFTPKGDITPDALNKALTAVVTVEQASSSLGEYDDTVIYDINEAFEIVHTPSHWTGHGTPNTAGVYDYYTHTIEASNLESAISIGSFQLPTEVEYEAFKTAIQDVKFRVRVVPGTGVFPTGTGTVTPAT